MAFLFEGSEKKLEIVVNPSVPYLHDRGEDFWERLVKRAGAQILSRVSCSEGIAYLLSESSLFVWRDKFILITCGRTTLTRALEEFLKSVPEEHVEFMIYERKNEYYPRQQRTDFFSDLEEIRKVMPGMAYRFGHDGEHHIYLFQSHKQFQLTQDDATTEILMYHIGGSACDLFSNMTVKAQELREFMDLSQLFPNFMWDDYVFDPCGYSINGLCGKKYVTVHVTPQDDGSYVSFESNVNFGQNLDQVMAHMVLRFQPQSFDVMTFRSDQGHVGFQVPGYWPVNCVEKNLPSGYQVRFMSHYLSQSVTQCAREIF